MNSRDAGDATRQAQHILLAIPSLFVTGVTFSQRDGVALSSASLFGQRSVISCRPSHRPLPSPLMSKASLP